MRGYLSSLIERLHMMVTKIDMLLFGTIAQLCKHLFGPPSPMLIKSEL